jgi:hypothetical protein
VRELSTALARIGHDIHILSPYPPCVFNGFPGVVIHPVGSRLLHNSVANGIVGRIQGSAFFWRNYLLRGGLESIAGTLAQEVLPLASSLELDVIQGEQDVAALACCLLKEKLDIPVVASLHNVLPEELAANGVVGAHEPRYRSAVSLVRRIALSASATVVISEEMKEFLVNEYLVPAKNMTVVPLAVRPRVKEITWVGRPNKIVLSGLASRLDAPMLYVDCASIVTKRSVGSEFYMTNRGELMREIHRAVNERGNPPRSQCLSCAETPTSFNRNPSSWRVSILPARDSED